jgi:hypothetical protein
MIGDMSTRAAHVGGASGADSRVTFRALMADVMP